MGVRGPFALVTIASIVLAGAAAVVASPDLVVSVLTASDRWMVGAPIPLAVRMANTGGGTLTLTFSNTCRAVVAIHDANGALTARLGHACGAMITASTLAPGESMEIFYRWDQTDSEGRPARASETYTLHARLFLLGPRPDLDTRFVPAVVRLS